jgi:drug/metabolite transporter (DMT)-like permease
MESLSDAFGSNAAGVAAMLFACAMFVIGDTSVKLAGATLPLGEIVMLRGLIALPIITWVAYATGALPQFASAAGNRRLLIRTLFEVGSTLLFLAGLIRMSYADAIAIQQFVPLAVIAGAAMFFGDKVGWRRWTAAVVGLIGVMIVVRPGAGTFNWPAMMIIGNVVCVAGRDLMTRKLGLAVPTALVALYSIAIVGASGFLLLPFETWRVPTLWEGVLVSVSGISSVGGFYWVAEALRRGDVSAIIPFRYALIPYGVMSGIFIFGEWPDGTTLIGIAIVLGAGLYALHRERVRTQEARRVGEGTASHGSTQ